MHPVKFLFNELQSFWYPPEVTPIPATLPKTAFFPGGYGLWHTAAGQDLPPWPERGIMVLGHNFGSGKEWRDTYWPNQGDVLNKGVWLHLQSLLDRTGIQYEQCFFTNAYIGLGEKHVGKFSGEENDPFVEQCLSFFRVQFLTQQPCLILALGLPVHKFLCKASAIQGKLASWGNKLKQLDHSTVGPVVSNVRFDLCEDNPTVVVGLVHTANRPTRSCVGIREYNGLTGDDAELAMLNDALKLAGLQTWQFVCDGCKRETFLFSCDDCKYAGSKSNVYQYSSLITGVVNNDFCCPICNAPITDLTCSHCGQPGRICAA